MDTVEFEGAIMAFMAAVEGSFEQYGKKTLFPALEMKAEHDEVKELFEILKETSVWDARNYLFVLKNAVEVELRNKNKDLKVKDLEIEIL